MKISRREMRINAITILYQIFLYEKSKLSYNKTDIINRNEEIKNDFVLELVDNTYEKKDLLDEKINKFLKDWLLDRLSSLDAAILRVAVYEILFTNTDDKICINEAIEISKSYSDDSVIKIVNGVLDKISKEKNNA
ncbi:MAG: transcription antitermination factor NusB [Bacilli bacterium]